MGCLVYMLMKWPSASNNYKWSPLTAPHLLAQTEGRSPFTATAARGGEAGAESCVFLHSKARNLLGGQVLAVWCPWAMNPACPRSWQLYLCLAGFANWHNIRNVTLYYSIITCISVALEAPGANILVTTALSLRRDGLKLLYWDSDVSYQLCFVYWLWVLSNIH